ncbi:unnamed protein product [Amoebophrya sp. A120]|nr:unnamed protein product [Amoebophrya sp. A120]|eukprot:GSA120T00024006001.1
MHVLVEFNVFWSLVGMLRMYREDSFRNDRWSYARESGVHIIEGRGSSLVVRDVRGFIAQWDADTIVCSVTTTDTVADERATCKRDGNVQGTGLVWPGRVWHAQRRLRPTLGCQHHK